MKGKYLYLWLAWMAAFGIIEGAAVMNPASGDTFSELVWLVMGTHPIIFSMVAGVLGWAVTHFVTRGKV